MSDETLQEQAVTTEQSIQGNSLTQDMFPGAWIELKWTKVDQITKAPFYAMRILLGANIVKAPRGQVDFVSVILEGKDYVLHIDNFNIANELVDLFLTAHMAKMGYKWLTDVADKLRYSPGLLIEGLEFMLKQASCRLDVPLNKARFMWITPDNSACGDHRSVKPFAFMNQEMQEQFYTERAMFMNFTASTWFDVFIMHRSPPAQLLAAMQQLQQSQKVIVYEVDDDIFNLPSWNCNAKYYTKPVIDRMKTAIQMADVALVSTEPLKEIVESLDIRNTCQVYVTPNLINFNEIGEALPCNHQLSQKYTGYRPVHDGKRIKFVHNTKEKPTLSAVEEKEYHPVRILWAGSPTHDEDLEMVVSAVLSIGKKYGLGVMFYFFGYCPSQFLHSTHDHGNTNLKYEVKPEYQHFITSYEGVPYHEYYNAIRKINPDIALCPLADHAFNLSKSNLKVLEMGAFGIPVVASEFGPYEFLDLTNSMLVKKSQDWEAYIDYLITRPIARQEIGTALRQKIMYEYSWNEPSENRTRWITAFNHIYELTMSRRMELIEKMTEPASQL